MLTERVIFLARGEVVANDTPAAIAASYGHADLEQVFLSARRRTRTMSDDDELAPHPHRHPPARLRAVARARTAGSTSRSGR